MSDRFTGTPDPYASREPGDGFVVTASPHLKAPESTPRIMWSVVAALAPVVAMSVVFFGPSALLVTLAAVAGAMGTEWAFGRPGSLRDGSAAITGVLLAMTLPAGMPMWMAFLGGSFGVGVGKLVFGGLGQNVFNPALLGRAFLQAAFPVAITTWPAPGGGWWALRGDNFALPLMGSRPLDVVTEATPLGLVKFEGILSEVPPLLLGTTGGSLGETSAVVILLCGVYLAARNHLNWRTPVSILATVGLLAMAFHALNPDRYPGAAFMLLSGGLMLGAVFMATDMVTSPTTNRGRWLYGFGIGALVVIIRYWGGLPEGVMYAILLMNALVPFIDRATRPRVFGTDRRKRLAAAPGGAT
jgi:Na+-translocating ferredoxin:NAD+ oxidoreductase subunit D